MEASRKGAPLLIEGAVDGDAKWVALPDIWRTAAVKYGERVALVDPHRDPPAEMTFNQVLQNYHIGVDLLGGGRRRVGLCTGIGLGFEEHVVFLMFRLRRPSWILRKGCVQLGFNPTKPWLSLLIIRIDG